MFAKMGLQEYGAAWVTSSASQVEFSAARNAIEEQAEEEVRID